MPRILVTRLSSFGDVAMLVPAIYSVAARYPQERFVVLTRKAFAPLFENLGFNVAVRVFDVKKHGHFFGLLGLTRSLAGGGYSHVADVHDVLRTKVIRYALMIGGKETAYIDKGREEKQNVIENKLLSPPLKPMVERYMNVFEDIGFPAEMTFTNFFEFKNRSLHLLRSVVPTEKTGKWIGIAPFAKHKGKVYPFEKMQKVIEELSKNPSHTIFLFGVGDKEKSMIKNWTRQFNNVIDVSGKFNLESEIMLISYLDVMVSMDSANMHLASLVEVPVVSIWGATHPSLGFYGYRQDPNNAIQVDISCRPCSVFGDLPCKRGDYACLNTIKESDIVNKVENILSHSKDE